MDKGVQFNGYCIRVDWEHTIADSPLWMIEYMVELGHDIWQTPSPSSKRNLKKSTTSTSDIGIPILEATAVASPVGLRSRSPIYNADTTGQSKKVPLDSTKETQMPNASNVMDLKEETPKVMPLGLLRSMVLKFSMSLMNLGKRIEKWARSGAGVSFGYEKRLKSIPRS